MCHEPTGALPAPTLYAILGSLYAGTHNLPQALRQMGHGLERSLTEYQVTEYDQDKNPAESVATATRHMVRAGELAAELGREVEAAQLAINGQGYSSNPPLDGITISPRARAPPDIRSKPTPGHLGLWAIVRIRWSPFGGPDGMAAMTEHDGS